MKNKIIEYRLLVSEFPANLSEDVTDLINQGYTPYGDTFTFITKEHAFFCQALVVYE